MSADHIILLAELLGGLVTVVCFAAFLMMREASHQELAHRVHTIGAGQPASATTRSAGGAVAASLRGLGNAVRRGTKLYSDNDLAALEGTIAASGYNPRRVLPIILGTKVVLAALFPIAVFVYSEWTGVSLMLRVVMCVVAAPVGMLLPDWLLGIARRGYVNALRKGVPDALDLLVICTEAGMGLESALQQVSREMAPSNRPIASALAMLLDELNVLPDRRQALTNFGNRSGVEGIRRMSTMLAQTLQYGTPLGQALRAVAGELRRERMVRLEERAVRLPALLVLPLVFFVMPSLFIVLGGIPMLGLIDLLTSMSAPTILPK